MIKALKFNFNINILLVLILIAVLIIFLTNQFKSEKKDMFQSYSYENFQASSTGTSGGRRNPVKAEEISRRLANANQRANRAYAEMIDENQTDLDNFLRNQAIFENAENEILALSSKCPCDCS